jgi:hypothetical protein
MNHEGHVCRKCKVSNDFAPSRIKHHDWICRKCAAQFRDKDFATYMRRKLSARLKGSKCPPTTFVRSVLNYKKIKDTPENRKLTLMRQDPNRLWTFENTRVVTTGECYILTRTQTEETKSTK